MPVPARTQVRSGYLARPDQRGTFPTVLVIPPAPGLDPSIRSLCRSVARFGLVGVALDMSVESSRSGVPSGSQNTSIDLYLFDEEPGDAAPERARRDRRAADLVDDMLRYLQAPQTSWSDPDRIGILGIGHGGRFAALAALRDDAVGALGFCYTPLAAGDPTTLDLLAGVDVPLLGVYGRQDELITPAMVDEARPRLPRARWLLYQDAGHDFLDESADGFDPVAAGDAEKRLVGFFLGALGARRLEVAR